MITEDYCSYEVSKLLKEKGFDEKTLSYYEDNVLCHGDWFEWNRSPLGHIAAPTHQIVMRWLREVHKIFIEIRIYFAPKPHYRADVLEFNDLEDIQWLDDLAVLPMKDTYEEAVEAALKYTLENLI
jgi:hypothetical protein